MREIKQNKKRNIKMILWFCIFSVAMFTAMLLLNKVEYGERISIVNSNEFYTNFEKWEITSNKEFAQTFSYDGKALYSFSIKYDIAEVNADAKWKIQLFTVENEKLLQEWEVESSGITSGGIQEYVLENPYNNIENMQFKIVVSMLTDGNSGVLLCGSANSSLREGEMYINNQIQEGDISILYSEVVNVKITIFYAFLLCVCFSAVICFGIWGNGFTKGIQLLKKWGQYFWTKKARLIKWCVVFLVSILLARGIEWLFIKIPWVGYHYEAHHIIRYLFWLTVCWGILIIYLQRKYLSQRPEVIVCSMLFLIGMLYIVTIQAEAEISWDESIHFWRAVGVSHASTGLANYAECYLYWHSGIPFGLPSEFESLRAIHTNIQNLYDVGVGIAANTDVLSKIYMVAYIPAAIFLKIGRGLQLPYWLVFKMGTVANLGLYVTLIYFAMCKLKSGKMILAVSASVGSALFLATVYSYDTWVIGWFVLGMAYFIGCMQKKEKLQNKELTVIILASTIAFLPKTIYFPLMLIYLLLPRNKFQDTRQYRRFFSAVLASIGLLGVGTVIGYIWILPVWIVFYFVCDISGKLFEKIGTKKEISYLELSVSEWQ